VKGVGRGSRLGISLGRRVGREYRNGQGKE